MFTFMHTNASASHIAYTDLIIIIMMHFYFNCRINTILSCTYEYILYT
jgi:hypothetical protein